MAGSIRHLTIWGVWITGAASLAVSCIFMLFSLLQQAGMRGGMGDFMEVYQVVSLLGQVIRMGFVLSLMLHLYAVNRDLTHADRSLEAARHGIGLIPSPKSDSEESAPN